MASRGITVLAGGLKETQRITRRAEAAGFDAAWSGEFLHRSAVVSVAAMAAATTRIGVGSAIAYAVGRSPLILANEARFLDEMSDGRLTLGLGTGTRRMMENWHGVKDPDGPASRMEELIPLLRRLWRLDEGPVTHEGRFYSVDIAPTADIQPPLRPTIPVYTAGVNARMIEVAGRVSDGLICHPTLTDRYLDEVARPAIARGAERTGRSAADIRLKGVIICSIAEDTATARREAAAQIAFYIAPKAYGAVMDASGFGAEAREIQNAFRLGDHQAMIDAVTDSMLDQMAVAGTVDEVREAMPLLEKRYDHAALYSPSFTLSPERVAENTEAILETFARPVTG
ncbi:5,10-methylenetetrahydromethanopterin reductase [Streptomyces albus]|uniref:5,10-methylenetetrahydromethanopterin reductase n=1 Tax=Streptomyces albus (strain ATCC 21838 / DSM 41398 / FERM P-419 / JCM 4703 / NBRC 107858) TaxID=1081613 RepID=A0A0B5F6U9_STRA4|nr:5,10-methylenetetrahydromethanopterin reductase [Streptomyces albus]AOU81598.1 5,10-methylenetetrahydromethanopterin reductase [Streptomyces albus]AYN37290.1 LLM class flavin-dependent oxidoreductase [Streptomyces albus]